MHIIYEKWNEILEHVRKEHELTDLSFKTWLLPLKIYKIEEHVVTIIASNDKFVTYITDKFKLPIFVAIAEITGEEYDIVFIKEEEAKLMDREKQPEKTSSSRPSINSILEKSNINPMHSIANYILKETSDLKILYVTSEYFTNELIETLRAGDRYGMTQFREKYRNIDVLLIDDVQFLIGKESTQEEFFHTFNTLYNADKQIIISSDRPPKDIETLEERLRTRFECGLIADISSPDFETRVAILRKKEEMERQHIDDEIINYIATNVKSNIRELEGAYNRLIALSTLEKREINMSLAEEAIKDIISPNQERKITLELILEIIAEHFNISPTDIKGNKRSSDIVFPRQICMYLSRDILGTPLKQIGEFLGGKDHTTILHGVEKISEEIKTKESTKQLVNTIKNKINPN